MEKETIPIYVKTGSGNIIGITIGKRDTANVIKRKIADIEDTNDTSYEQLVYCGRILSGDRCLVRDFGVQKESTLELIKGVAGGMEILVRYLTGKEIPIHVSQYDTVEGLKFT